MRRLPVKILADLVVNISSGEPYDVYIGRGRCPRTGSESPWGNPFRIGPDGSRDDVIDKYASWIVRQPRLMSRIKELRGKRLGCWCSPLRCHGHILVEFANMPEEENEEGSDV
jgi:hypothetical protein